MIDMNARDEKTAIVHTGKLITERTERERAHTDAVVLSVLTGEGWAVERTSSGWVATKAQVQS